MNITPNQKSQLISKFPELRDWLEQREIVQALKEIKGTLSTPTDHLVTMLFNRIDTVKGDPGEKPIKGVDYWTPQELNHIVEIILNKATPRKGIDYNDGENGNDYVLTKSDKKEIASLVDVPVVEKIIEKTEIVKEVLPKFIDVSSVKGAVSKKDLESTTKKIDDGMARIDGRLKLVDQRWHGGGLSQVSHDSTLTGTGTASSPLSVVGGGFSGSQEKSTTVPNSVLTTFTFTHAPKVIFWNGAFQTLTDDYTVSGNNITFTGSAGTPLTGDKIVNLYA